MTKLCPSPRLCNRCRLNPGSPIRTDTILLPGQKRCRTRMWACRHTLDGSVGGRLHDTTGVLAESGSEKEERKDMSKANKGAWQNSATGIASHRIASHWIASHRIAFCQQSVSVSGRRRRRRCCCAFWIFYRLWYRHTCMHAKYPDECERITGIGVVHRLVVIASCVLHRSLCIL